MLKKGLKKAKKSLEGTEKSVPLQSPNEKGGPARGERIERYLKFVSRRDRGGRVRKEGVYWCK